MNILFTSSEVFPFYKSGGLADVAYALPKAIKGLGHNISVIMPKYSKIDNKYFSNALYETSIHIHNEVYNIISIEFEHIKYYFVENFYFYERENIYGDDDEDFQYTIFSEIVLLFIKNMNLHIDIIHTNDWQTASINYFINEKKKYDDFYEHIKTIYTIHNLKYQGRFSKRSFDYLGYYIDQEYLNLMALGIIYSDVCNTVSETYAEEIKNPYFSEGLEYITNQRMILGITNGIDFEYFNPETNSDLYYNYNAGSLEYKYKNKVEFQKELGLPENVNTPIISMVSRLVEAKGFDLVNYVLDDLLKKDVQVVVLGSGDKHYEDSLKFFEAVYPDKIKVILGYNPSLANRIYASSDMFLMPSQYEPCGLSQLISMRFGTIPIVRETGGLKDTVKPYNYFNGTGNGFTFTNFNADDMLYVINNALETYKNKDIWKILMIKNMLTDNSWTTSAKKYIDIYKKIAG